MRTILFTVTILLSSLLAQAQFEGKLTYKISYENLPPEMAQMQGMLPQGQMVWIKGDLSRFEQGMMQGNITVISNNATGESTMLMDMMGQKYKLAISADEAKQLAEKQPKPEIEYVNETKEIAGMTCKKAIIKIEGLEEPAIAYYTEEIPAAKIKGMENIRLKGMFLSYRFKAKGMTMTYEATEVDRSPVSDSTFEVPEGYAEMPANMKAMMGLN